MSTTDTQTTRAMRRNISRWIGEALASATDAQIMSIAAGDPDVVLVLFPRARAGKVAITGNWGDHAQREPYHDCGPGVPVPLPIVPVMMEQREMLDAVQWEEYVCTTQCENAPVLRDAYESGRLTISVDLVIDQCLSIVNDA